MLPRVIAIIAIGLFVVYAIGCAVRYFTSREDFKGTHLLIAGLAVLVLIVGAEAYSEHLKAVRETVIKHHYADVFLRDMDTGIRSWNDQEQWEAKQKEFLMYCIVAFGMAFPVVYDEDMDDMEIFRIFCQELSMLGWDAECREEVVEGFVNEPIGWISNKGLQINKPAYIELIDMMRAEREGDV